MKVIKPSEVDGRIKAPASKSATIRALAAALLGDGVSEIENPSFCDDAMTALLIARTLGATSIRGKDRILMNGNKAFAHGRIPAEFIDCNESGLCMRMFPPVAALAGGRCVIGGKGPLMTRPAAMVESIADFGVACTTMHGCPPVTIDGRLRGGTAHIDGSISSQFLSGLLLALPLCDEDSRLHVRNPASKPYIEMTIRMAEHFGIAIHHDEDMELFSVPGRQRYRPALVEIEGDWSGAAFPLVAAAIAGSVCVQGLDMTSCQADRAILSALDAAGAACNISEDLITVEKKELRPFQFDATDCPDLVPPLVALAAHCRGKSIIHGTARLRYKESDRSTALASQFGSMGIAVDVETDRIEVKGSRPCAATVDPLGDHRIAMACAVAALGASGPVTISSPGCVAKSYGEFFKDLESIRSSHE